MQDLVLHSEEKLPSLKYSDFCKQSQIHKKHKGNTIITSNKSIPNGIFTVYESLQDDIVLKNLNIATGSIDQYIDFQTTDPTPQLPNIRQSQKKIIKKPLKKNEPKEDQSMSGKKAFNQIQKNPYDILKKTDDEKTRAQAAKQIVSQIFKKIYGDEIDKFEEKNAKHIIEQQFFEGNNNDNPKISFIRKLNKISVKERFETFEKQLGINSQKNQSLKLKVDVLPNKTG